MAKKDLEIKDLLTDQSFIQWVKEPDPQLDAYWQKWLFENPEYTGMVEEARELLNNFQFQEENLSDDKIESIRINIENKINDASSGGHFYLNTLWKGIAAAFLVFIIGYSIIFLLSGSLEEQKKVVTTQYGETKQLTLPDQSQIILNANSTISYTNNLNGKNAATREVWLEGEAFFRVNELKGSSSSQDADSSFIPFIVHTDNIDIEVLGTRFNVNQRGEHTSVVLNSGKVQLNNLPAGINNISSQTMTMLPGDYVEFIKDSAKIKRKQVNPELYSSWKDNRLAFDNNSLGEIAETLYYNYGYKVRFGVEDLKTFRFTGSTPTDNLNILFQAIEESFGLDVVVNRKNKQIILSKEKSKQK